MSSTTPLTDSINNLTDYINGVTSGSDTNLSDAVATLASGYGGGGDADAVSALVTGIFDKDYTFTDTTIGRAFANCTGSHNLYFPNCTSMRVKNYTFEESTFNTISLPSFTGSLMTTFRSCKAKHILVENATSISGNGFRSCSNLEEIFLPKSSADQQAFYDCTSLKTAVVKALGNAYQQFYNCSSLESVDVITINNNDKIDNTFTYAVKLTTLVIRSSTVHTLYNTSAFNNTPFASGGTGGTLYVPSALISSYQSANNWSTILGYANNSIAAIEGSQYENYYADGTPIASS